MSPRFQEIWAVSRPSPLTPWMTGTQEKEGKPQMKRDRCQRGAVCACSATCQVRPTLCDAMEPSPPGSSVHGILQARTLRWVAMPFSRGSSQRRDWTQVSYDSCTVRSVLYHQHHLGGPRCDLRKMHPAPTVFQERKRLHIYRGQMSFLAEFALNVFCLQSKN